MISKHVVTTSVTASYSGQTWLHGKSLLFLLASSQNGSNLFTQSLFLPLCLLNSFLFGTWTHLLLLASLSFCYLCLSWTMPYHSFHQWFSHQLAGILQKKRSSHQHARVWLMLKTLWRASLLIYKTSSMEIHGCMLPSCLCPSVLWPGLETKCITWCCCTSLFCWSLFCLDWSIMGSWAVAQPLQRRFSARSLTKDFKKLAFGDWEFLESFSVFISSWFSAFSNMILIKAKHSVQTLV